MGQVMTAKSRSSTQMKEPVVNSGSVNVTGTGQIATVTLESAGKLNAISESMWQMLARTFVAFTETPDLRAVVVRGAGHNFAAGADIDEFERVRGDAVSGRRYHLETIANALEAIAACPVPVLAAIEGVCVGGGLEVAVNCDLRIASDNARLGAPVGRIGFPLALPELGPLLRLVGPGVAAELLLEGRLLDAREAVARGLVTRAVPADRFEQEVRDSLMLIAAGSPRAARENKRNIRRLAVSGGRYTEHQLDESFGFLESEDYREGTAAFIAKRPPRFTGR
jgi:enoyl-CoA hydratase/carnithine racemase